MKILLAVLLLAFCLPARAETAGAAPGTHLASAETVKHLLDVMHAESLLDKMTAQMKPLMKSITQAACRGHQLTPADRAEVNAMVEKVTAAMQQELSWSKIEPIYIQVYTETFTEDEINGMAAFYAGPVGRAALEKMPQVMQRTVVLMQPMMRGMVTRMQAQVTQFVADIEAKHAGKSG